MLWESFVNKIAKKAVSPIVDKARDITRDVVADVAPVVGNVIGGAASAVGNVVGNVVGGAASGLTGTAKSAAASVGGISTGSKGQAQALTEKGLTATAQKAIADNAVFVQGKAAETGDLLLKAAATVEEEVISPYITRPVSTLALVTDPDSPLYAPGKYEKGFQVADIARAYNRSEQISMGVALTQSDLIPGFKQLSNEVLYAGGVDIANVNLWDDQNVQKNFSDNVVGRYFTGLTDLVAGNAVLFGAGKAVSTAGKLAIKSAGLSAKGTTLAKFEQDANDGILNIVTNGERGRLTNTAQELNQVAESKDINLISSFVQKYSNNERLIPLLQDTTDPAMVRDFILADKGYLPALERLANKAPDDLAELADLPGYIRSRNLLNDDVYQPVGDALPRIKAAFESAIKKNPEHAKIYQAFLDSDGYITSMGKTDVFPLEPKFATEKISKAITGTRAVKAKVATRDFTRKSGHIDEQVLGSRANGMLASIVRFGGTYKPLGFVTFSGARPFDGLVEINAIFDDLKLFTNGQNLIKVGGREVVTAAEYRSKVLADFTSAATPVARREVLDKLDARIVHDIARSYDMYDTEVIARLQTTMRNRANRATEQFGQHGFGMDATGRGVFTSAQTQSQIAESFRMSPLNSIEREILRAKKGVTAGKFDSTRAALGNAYETLTKYWTFDVLARPSYIVKQSWLEPILSAGMSQGTKYVLDQVPTFTKNALKNTRNRLKGSALATVNAKQAKEVGDVVDSITKQLSEAIQQREFLSAESYRFFETDLVSPATRRDYGDIVKAELKRADKAVEDLELELQNAAIPFGGVEEIPSIATLERRLRFIESAQPDIKAVTAAPVVTDSNAVINLLNSQRAKGFSVENYKDFEESLVNYTNGSGDYSLVNSVLRGDYKAMPKEATRAKKITADLDVLISKAPKLEESITTFRGISDKAVVEKLLALKPGDSFVDKAFTSTSLKESTAQRFARDNGVIVEIVNPAGTKGIFPLGFRTNVDNTLMSRPSAEAELLLARNTKFYVTEVKGNRIKVTLDSGIATNTFKAKNAAAIANAKAAIAKAKGELNTLVPDAKLLTEKYDEIAAVYDEIDNVILKDLGEAQYAQAKVFERSVEYKKRYYGKESSYTFIGDQYVKIDSLFDENQLGAALREEFANARTVATTFAGELTVGTKNSILLRRGPRSVTNINEPLYFEELAYVANRTLRNDPLVKLVLNERSLEDIQQWALSTPGKRYMSQFGDYSDSEILTIARNRVGLVKRTIPDVRARALLLEREVTSIELQKILSEDLSRLSPLHPIDFDYDMVSESVGAKGAGAAELAADRAMGFVWGKLTRPENPVRWSFADKVFRDIVTRKAEILQQQGVKLTIEQMNAIRASATRESLQEAEKTFYTVRRKNRAVWASRVLTAFPAASLNAFYRYGRFAIKNPTRMAGFLHNYQSTFRSFGVDENGNPVDDPRKAKFLVIPGTKELGFNNGKGVMVNARSLGFLINLPAPSYIATIPMTLLFKQKPTAEETFRQVLGPTYDSIFPYGAPSNVLSPLMPSWAKDLYKSIVGPEGDGAFMETVKSVANYHNVLAEMGIEEKMTQQQFFDEARGLYFKRFRSGFASPLGVPTKVDTNPMALFDNYYNTLINKYLSKNMNRSDAMSAAEMEFLATVAPNFPIDRVSYKGSTSNTYIPATASAYNRIWKDNADLIESVGALGKDGALIGLLTLDIDASKEDTSLSVYNFLKDPKTRLPDGSPLNKFALTPEKEEKRRQVNRVWEEYTKLRDALDAQAQLKTGKPLRRNPELSKALSDYADTELKAKSLDWWKEKKGQLAGGADNSFNYARAFYEITNDKNFMKKYGDSPVWQDAKKFTQIRNAITIAYQSFPQGDPRKSRLKEAYLDYIATNLGTYHPKVQEIMKRYFDDDTMKVVTD